MADLLFIITVLSLFVFAIIILIKLFRRIPIISQIKKFVAIAFSYIFIWSIFFFLSKDKPVGFGVVTCFDDWCATVTKVEHIKKQNFSITTQKDVLVIYIEMSNRAKGRAQKPSEPRVRLIDCKGNEFEPWADGQKALEAQRGMQPDIGVKLELKQHLNTQLVFQMPDETKGLQVVIEEGPFITKLLLWNDRSVYLIENFEK